MTQAALDCAGAQWSVDRMAQAHTNRLGLQPDLTSFHPSHGEQCTVHTPTSQMASFLNSFTCLISLPPQAVQQSVTQRFTVASTASNWAFISCHNSD